MKFLVHFFVTFSGFFTIWALSSFSWNMSWKFGVGFTFGLLSNVGAQWLQMWLEWRIFHRRLRIIDDLFSADMAALDKMMKHPLVLHGIHADKEVCARYAELVDLIRTKVQDLPDFEIPKRE